MPFLLSIVSDMPNKYLEKEADVSMAELMSMYAMLAGFIATAPTAMADDPLMSIMKKIHYCIDAFLVPGDRAELAKLSSAIGHAKNELSDKGKDHVKDGLLELFNRTIDNL